MTVTNDFRVSTLDNFIGQANLIGRLKPFLIQAVIDEVAVPHVLLTSKAGMGKTSLGLAIANFTGDPVEVVDFGRMTPVRMASFFRRFRGVIICDEVHSYSKATQNLLLTVMEEGYFPSPHGGKIKCPNLTFIGLTDQPEKLLPAFVSRFAIKLRYEDYTADEMLDIVASMADSARVNIDPTSLSTIANASSGIPRTARDLVQAWAALSFTGEVDIDTVLDMCGLENDGLTLDHMNYLRALDDLEGQAGERVVARISGLHPFTMAGVEKLLLDRGYIAIVPQGRRLTDEGMARLNGGNDESVSARRARMMS